MKTEQKSIGPRSTMQEVLEQYPGARRALFRKYHLGGCSSCGFKPTETLLELCQRNNELSVDEVIKHILSSHEEDRKLQIDPKELDQLRRQNANTKILDVRTREEFEAVKIDGAILFSQDLLMDILGKWNRQDPLIICDHMGGQSMDAAAYLMGHGFTNVRALRGGIDAWSQEVDGSLPRYSIERE